MTNTLFTATGCRRCGIVRSALEGRDLKVEELDIKAEGRDAFNAFYRQNRPRVFRGEHGIEFPILVSGDTILQGAGVILAWLRAGEPLLRFAGPSSLIGDWVGGFTLSPLDPGDIGRQLIPVMAALKKGGLKIELETNGRNPHILATSVEHSLVDRLRVVLLGSDRRYRELTGASLDPEDLEKTLALVSQVPEVHLELCLIPVMTADGPVYPAIDEAVRTAALVEQITGSKKHRFVISAPLPAEAPDLEPLPQTELFRYRTACRRHMVLAEILKPA